MFGNQKTPNDNFLHNNKKINSSVFTLDDFYSQNNDTVGKILCVSNFINFMASNRIKFWLVISITEQFKCWNTQHMFMLNNIIDH